MDIKQQISSIRTEIDAAIAKVLDSGVFVLGDYVNNFEEEFARRFNVKHAIACNSGTSALHLALEACGVKAGDEVIIPGMTFIATASAVIYSGATPVVVDVLKDSWLIDPSAIEDAITDKTVAIMPVHLHGRMADLKRIREIATKHNLIVIEDSAQSHLAKRDGILAGSYGDAAGFSFYPGKNLGACGEGGIVTTNSDEIADKIRILRDWGALKKYKHDYLGYNYRMDALQGAILSVKLKHLETWTILRENAVEKYRKKLEATDYKLPKTSNSERHVFHILATLVHDRDQVMHLLQKNDIGVGTHYPFGIHEQVGINDKIRVHGKMENTEFFARHNLSLPLFPEITSEQINFVCEKLVEFSDPVLENVL